MSTFTGFCSCGDPVTGSGGVTPVPPPVVTMTNDGGLAEVYKTTTGPNPFELRTLGSSDGTIIVTQDVNTIDFQIELVNLGNPETDGCAIWDENVNPYGFKRLFTPVDSPFSLSCEASRIRIDYTGSFANEGGGVEVYDDTASTPASQLFRTLVAGTNVAITQNATTIEIASTTAADTVQNIGGGAEVYVNATDFPFELRTIMAGDGIAVTQGANVISIDNTDPGSAVTLASAGGTETLVNDGTGPALATKGLTAGTGISLTGAATSVTIANTDPGSGVSLANAGTTSLVNDGIGPALATKGLVAGTGISLGVSATDVTITNSDPASGVSLSNAGTTSLVNDGTGPALATKGLVAGTGISFSTSATDITITNSAASIGGTMFKMLINGSDHSGSERTVKTAETAPGCLGYVNIGSGSQVCKIQWKSVTNGNTSTVTNRQLYAASNLGTTTVASATGSITVTSSTYADMTTMSITLIAGEWLIFFSCDMVPAP